MLKISKKKDEKWTKEMLDLLHRIQKNSIAVSVDMGELISLIKRQDSEYAKQIEEMEK